MKIAYKQIRKPFIKLVSMLTMVVLSSHSVLAQDPPDCNSPVGASILVTDTSGSTLYADTLFGPYEVNYEWTGSPVTFWFDVAQDFDNGMITPSQDWGNCQMDGNATWQVSPTSGASINVWSDDDADITFNSTGSWTVTATHPGWTCENGDCGDSIGPKQESVDVNIVLTCDIRLHNTISESYIYFASVGWQWVDNNYHLKISKCSDGSDRFLSTVPQHHAYANPCPRGEIDLVNFSVRFSLREFGGSNTWYGPTSIPSSSSHGGLTCTGGDVRSGVPLINASHFEPNEAFYDAISVAVDTTSGLDVAMYPPYTGNATIDL